LLDGAVTDTLAAAISILFHGTALAMVLYLISVGLSVTMGLMGFVNLAHGVFAMLGGYVLTSLIGRHGARPRGSRLPTGTRHRFPSTSASTFPAVFSRMFPSLYDAAMATPRHPVNAVQFRLGRIQRDWHDITAILRAAAADPGYSGPDIEAVEKLEEIIAQVRAGVRNWILAGGPPRRNPPLRGRERAVVLQAIRRAVAER
jgi:hypothetical protein